MIHSLVQTNKNYLEQNLDSMANAVAYLFFELLGHCHFKECHFSAANLVNCCESLVLINQTIMPGDIVHLQYVLQAKSLQEQLFK